MLKALKKRIKDFAESLGNLIYGSILTFIMLIAFVASIPFVLIVVALTNLKKLVLKIRKLL